MAGKRLESLLGSYSATAVRMMAEGRGLALSSNPRKGDTIAKLAEVGPDPASVGRALADLSPQQRALLDLLVLYPGEVGAEFILRAGQKAGILQREKRDPSGGYYGYNYYSRFAAGNPKAGDSKNLADLLAGLSYRVLALTTSTGGYSYGGTTQELGLANTVCVPGEIRPVLVAALAPALPLAETPPGPPATPDPRSVHRALFLLWSAVRAKPAGLIQSGLIRKSDARRLGQALGVAGKDTAFDAENDLPYLFFARRAAGRLGLLLAREGMLEAAGRDRLREFLAQPWPVRSLRLLQAWLADAASDLNAAVQRLQWQVGQGVPAIPGALAYRRFLALLAGLPDGWIDLDRFVYWVRLRHFGFLALSDDDPLAEYDLGTALYRLPYGGLPGDDPWEAREGAVIRDGVRTALHWLGAVELAGTPATEGKAGTQAFRLTALGRALLAAQADPAHEAEILAPLAAQTVGGRVIIQPNFQILAVGEVPDETLFALSEVAELVRAEQAVEFKLTRESVYAAQQGGWTPVAILDLLRTASAGTLAQNVERSILDWAAAHERIVVRRGAALLAARDAALLDRLTADPTVAPLLGDRLLPTLALLRPGPTGALGSLLELDQKLLALGELPAQSNLVADDPVPAFSFDPAGRVTWRGPLPDLRLLGLLASIARPAADGVLALDERTTRATALARRWKPADVTALLDALAAWHVGPLPLDVARQVKIWAGFQGRARLRTVTILEVERPELLADLQADPTLAPLLQPLPVAGTAALVQFTAPESPPPPPPDGRKRKPTAPTPPAERTPGDPATLRETLRRYGFTLDDSES
jgi:hypothetical protein